MYCGDIGTDGKEYERNRIDEGYELYLKDAVHIDTAKESPEDFILQETVMNNADYTVWLRMPCVVPRGCAVKMIVTVRKNSEKTKELSFHARLQMPAFTDLAGNHELKIDIDRLMPPKGQCTSREYWICADNAKTDETTILCRREDMQFQVGKYAVEPRTGISLGVRLSNQPPYDLAAREIGKTNLDTELKQNIEEGVCIAVLHFLRKDVSCLLSGVQECGVKHYIVTPGKEKQRQLFLSYFTGKDTAQPSTEDSQGN